MGIRQRNRLRRKNDQLCKALLVIGIGVAWIILLATCVYFGKDLLGIIVFVLSMVTLKILDNEL